MTATCLPDDLGDGGTADVTADTPNHGAVVIDTEAGGDHEPRDGGATGRDSTPDEQLLFDVATDRTDGAPEEGDASSDAAAKNDATLDRQVDTASGMDANRNVDAAEAADAFADAMPDAPADVAPDLPVCDASPGRSPLDEPCLIDERYGSFVSPGGNDSTGQGTRTAPFQTIGRGMRAAKLGGPRVFVCDDGIGYPDPIVADASTDGLAIYGGFNCRTWVPSASSQARVQPKGGPAITMSQLTSGITIENFDLRAADAAPGMSSIAARFNGAAGIVLRRCRIAAGTGGAGTDGVDGAAGENASPAGDAQRGLSPFCNGTPAIQPGAVSVGSNCGAPGGQGGQGSIRVGGIVSYPANDGQPKTGVSPLNRSNAGTACRSDTATPGTANGSQGADGLSGMLGTPAPISGTFSETGYASSGPGGDGTPGNPGQGGGGGVGCPAATNCVGPSGGAGGAAGCGGKHGTGGGAGGASIGLLSWRSTVVLDRCEVLSANGGAGGKGGNGGSGGKGAAGGGGNEGVDGSDPSGAGGVGGEGGPGAAAAGGNGGPTYGIVFAGARPSQTGTTVTFSLGGSAGTGGTTPASPISPSRRAADGFVGDANYDLAIP
jgi:hypothetical protein